MEEGKERVLFSNKTIIRSTGEKNESVRKEFELKSRILE